MKSRSKTFSAQSRIPSRSRLGAIQWIWDCEIVRDITTEQCLIAREHAKHLVSRVNIRSYLPLLVPSTAILDFAGAGALAWVWLRPHMTNSAVFPRRWIPSWRPKGQGQISTNDCWFRNKLFRVLPCPWRIKPSVLHLERLSGTLFVRFDCETQRS